MSSKEDQIQIIFETAPRYALTGKYQDWRDIAKELQKHGHRDVCRILDNDMQRKYLNELCEQAGGKT